jgi:YD repeat-containing protein
MVGRGKLQTRFVRLFACLLSVSFFTSPLQAFAVDEDWLYYQNRIDVSSRVHINASDTTGAFTMSYPISVPPGRNGLQPSLSLSYSSRTTDNVNLVGYGWTLDIPYIERFRDEGTTNLYDQFNFTSSFDGELKNSDGATTTENYGALVDYGDFRKYQYNNLNYWTVTDKSGTRYTFGSTTAARIYNTSTTTQIYRWMLTEIRDRNDNVVTYAYDSDRGFLYPSTITYTGHGATDGIFQIAFTKELRDDVATTTISGFGVSSRYRISEIQAKINGEWVRKYSLGYSTGDNGVRSLLTSITETGRDESGGTITLPPTQFTYQTDTPTWTETASYTIPESPIDTGQGDNGVRFADVNGDGLPDLIRSLAGSPDFDRVYLNDGDGTGWTNIDDPAVYSIPAPFIGPLQDDDNGFRMFDVNGDGYADIVRSDEITNTVGVWINNRTNGWTLDGSFATTSTPVWFADAVTGNGTDMGLRIMDVNGDGLADMVKSNASSSAVYINRGNGTGWTADVAYTVPVSFLSPGWFDGGVRFTDVNGDGLIDLLKSSTSASTIAQTYINKGDGTGWALDRGYSLQMSFVGETYTDEGVRIFDVNGDGLDDIVKSYYNEPQAVYINKGNGTGWATSTAYTAAAIPDWSTSREGYDLAYREFDVDGDSLIDIFRSYKTSTTTLTAKLVKDGKPADILTRIFDSNGKITTVAYKGTPEVVDGSGTRLNPSLPARFDVVSTIATNDGNGNIATTTYTYGGGRYYFASPVDRKFAGFATTTETDALGNVTRKYFHQGDNTYASYGEYQDHKAKIGKPYRIEVYGTSTDLFTKTIYKWDRISLGADRNFVALTQTMEFGYDGDSDHRDTAKTFSYENTYGNLTGQVDWGEVTGSDNGTFTDIGTDQASTTISYAINAHVYVVGTKSQETTHDVAGSKVKETRFYYDDLSQGSVDKGNLTKQESWKSGNNYIDIEKTYNSYGLVTQDKDPRDKITSYVYDAYNLHVASSTNPLSLQTQFYRDFSSGAVRKTVDPNGREFETTYDAFDRKTAEKIPDITTPATLVTKTEYAYTDARPRSILQTNYLSAATSTLIYTYFDGLNRKIQERVEAEDSNTFAIKDFIYDLLGRPKKESLPYFATGSASSSPTATAALYSNYIYDPLGRVTAVGNAVGTTTNTYNQWETVITDALGNTKDLTNDARGNLVQVEERNDGSTYITTYAYNLLGNLTKITDALGNVRGFVYDALGRVILSEDLHVPADITYGITVHTYDDAGNLIHVDK